MTCLVSMCCFISLKPKALSISKEEIKKILNLPKEPEYVSEASDLYSLRAIKKQTKGIAGVYGWMCKKDNRVYVGGTKNLSVRPFSHLTLLGYCNLFFWNSLNKYGRDTRTMYEYI